MKYIRPIVFACAILLMSLGSASAQRSCGVLFEPMEGDLCQTGDGRTCVLLRSSPDDVEIYAVCYKNRRAAEQAASSGAYRKAARSAFYGRPHRAKTRHRAKTKRRAQRARYNRKSRHSRRARKRRSRR